MRSNGSANWISGQGATWWTSTLLASALALTACSAPSPEPSTATSPPQQRPARPDKPEPVQPVSEACTKMVDRAEREGLIRPGTIDRDGAVILVDTRWTTRLDADLQQALALCLSHYIAGGENRWIKRMTFKNQATGVTYATVEGDRFRIGE